MQNQVVECEYISLSLSPESAPPQNLTRAEKDNMFWHYNDSLFALKREHSFLSISHSL